LFEKIKVFLKNQKHEPNIVEVTQLCIMHRVHTSIARGTVDNHVVSLNIRLGIKVRLENE
jgi:hypothetical protein